MAEQDQQQAPKIVIDGVEYDVDSLSTEVKNLINTLRMADGELRRTEVQLTLARIARQAIANSLKAELEKMQPASA